MPVLICIDVKLNQSTFYLSALLQIYTLLFLNDERPRARRRPSIVLNSICKWAALGGTFPATTPRAGAVAERPPEEAAGRMLKGGRTSAAGPPGASG